MTAPARAYDPIRFHRGTRGFAALVAAFSGIVVLALSLFVVPGLALDRTVASWSILLGTVAGVAHLVAAVGLIRGKRWSAELVGYLAAAGIGVAMIVALLTATDLLDAFHVDRGSTIAVAFYLSFWWAVAARYALRPFSFDRPWSSVGTVVPMPQLPRRRPARVVAAPAATRQRQPVVRHAFAMPGI